MRTSFLSLVKRFAREERGASMVEYAVLIGLVTVAVVAAIGGLSGSIQGALNGIAGVIDGSTTAATGAGG